MTANKIGKYNSRNAATKVLIFRVEPVLPNVE
jgi:hypothetical protein